MKKYMVLFSAFLLLFTLSGVAGAYSINYLNTLEGDGNSYTSPYSGVTVETFDTVPPLWTWIGNAAIISKFDNFGFPSAPPYGKIGEDQTFYVSVPFETVPPSPDYTDNYVSVTDLGGTYNYFGLWWGSVDEYNKLEFFNSGDLVATVNGLDVSDPANGNQTDPSTNRYVNILDLPLFDSFRMTSNQYAFEADNITVGNVPVPEPTTMLLLGLGLVGLAGMARRFKR